MFRENGRETLLFHKWKAFVYDDCASHEAFFSLAKDIHALKWYSQWVTGCFCFMCHYDIAYRGPDTRSANIAQKRVPFQTFTALT